MSTPNYPLGLGLRPYLLPHLRDIIGSGNLPQTKIEHVGFLNFLQAQDRPEILRLDNAAGHRNSVQVKYLQRLTEDYAQTDESQMCNVTTTLPYREATVNTPSFAFVAIHIDNDLLAKYEDDATSTKNLGTPSTPIMKEFLEQMMAGANALLTSLRTQLLTTLVVGTNRATGNANAKTINFPLNSTNNPLNADINEILTDFDINLMTGTPNIIAAPGSWMHRFLLQQYAKSYNQAGINTAIEAAGITGFIDTKIATLFGPNQFLAIEKNSVQLVEYMRYTAFRAGWMPGNSMFGTIPLPVQVGNDVRLMEFDYQLRFNDCPATITDSYYGTPFTMQPGYTIILSKRCGIFQIPPDAWKGGDPEFGTNGVLRYDSTNA